MTELPALDQLHRAPEAVKSFQLKDRMPCLNCLGSKALCPEPVHSLYDYGYGASVRPREALAHAF